MENKITEAICKILFKRMPWMGTGSQDILRAEIAEVVRMILEARNNE